MKKKGQNVAKGKSAAKKTAPKIAKKNAKKNVKKMAPKKAAQSAVKAKAKPAAKAKNAAKPVKKAAAKKSVAKKASPVKKGKAATKSAVKPAAKSAKTSTNSSKKTSKKPAPQKATAIKTTPAQSFLKKPAKTVDLSDFVTPLDDRVMIQLAGIEKMTPGGLYIPDTAADVEGNIEGFVVSVGRGHRNKKGHVRPMDLQVGDKVLVTEHAGSKIKIQDQDVLIVREGDVLGVVS